MVYYQAAVRLLSRGLRWLTEGIETAAVSQYGESAELDEAMGAQSAHTTVLDQAVQQTSNNSCPVSVRSSPNVCQCIYLQQFYLQA